MEQNDIIIDSYDKYIIAFSGGKDSLACLLHLLDTGVPRSKIELWHHNIDGDHGKDDLFMDWEVTHAYCEAVAKAFGIPIYFSWKMGGFEREMLRDQSLTAPIQWQNPDGTIGQAGGVGGTPSTRMKFPQVSPDLSVRWCSSYLKIDVCATSIRNQSRFDGKRTLVLSGERAEESAARAKYKLFEPDRADGRDGRKKRLVDRWRPVLYWSETQVWEIIEKYRVRAHPAYYLGFGRVSCKFCIFGNARQLASAAKISPEQAEKIFRYERDFGVTIKRNTDLQTYIEGAETYPMKLKDVMAAKSSRYTLPVIMEPGEWYLPAGAYGESCGPV